MQQNAQNIENLLGGTSAAGKDHNTVPGTHESLEALFDVGHDHQLVDNRVGRFGGDDARLTDTQIPAVVHSLFGVANGGAFHGAFHSAGGAAGSDIQSAHVHLVAHDR